jgi:hypothetical protein
MWLMLTSVEMTCLCVDGSSTGQQPCLAPVSLTAASTCYLQVVDVCNFCMQQEVSLLRWPTLQGKVHEQHEVSLLRATHQHLHCAIKLPQKVLGIAGWSAYPAHEKHESDCSRADWSCFIGRMHTLDFRHNLL